MYKVYIILVIASAIDICLAQKQRIGGGENADILNFPYMVSLRWTYGASTPMHFCGGSIISRNHIVTAAHCLEDKRSPYLLSYIRIYTGTSRSDYGGNVYSVKSINIHPNYMGEYTTYQNDIAIVTLAESIEFNEFQKPISLPSRNVPVGSIAVVTGWGSTNSVAQDTPIILQGALMKLVPSYECRKYLPYSLTDSQVCAINSAGIGVCSGDSGGPLAVDGVLIGIASFVVDCAKGYPDVYTNVYSFIDFIYQVVNYNPYI